MKKPLRIGILDLLRADRPSRLPFTRPLRAQFSGIMPQAVSVWAREMGHESHYAAYYGQAAPETLLPEGLDIVFIVHFTKATALAYALSRLFKNRGVRTVAAGPHARSFPEDCLRFFDIAVQRINKELVKEIIEGHIEPGYIVDTQHPVTELPSVEQREPEIQQAHFHGGKFQPFSLIPLLASTGCPYKCHFCVDANSDYQAVSQTRLQEELQFISRRWPGRLIGFHDPNFGVQFDQVMTAMESIPPHRRNPYIIQTSLSVLKKERLPRMAATNCAYIAPGIESWSCLDNKTGTGPKTGREKLEAVIEHFEIMRPYAKGFQANFVFGTDIDQGVEPVALTVEFIRRLPHVYSGIFIPTPFAGTTLFDQIRSEGRLLETMPFACYYNPYLTFRPANYHPTEYYGHLVHLYEALTKARLWGQRMASDNHPVAKLIQTAQVIESRRQLTTLRTIHRSLQTEPAFRAFHEGRSGDVPDFYLKQIADRLGPYYDLLKPEDLRPLLPEAKTNTLKGAA